jgi:hypothetical protein
MTYETALKIMNENNRTLKTRAAAQATMTGAALELDIAMNQAMDAAFPAATAAVVTATAVLLGN